MLNMMFGTTERHAKKLNGLRPPFMLRDLKVYRSATLDYSTGYPCTVMYYQPYPCGVKNAVAQ